MTLGCCSIDAFDFSLIMFRWIYRGEGIRKVEGFTGGVTSTQLPAFKLTSGGCACPLPKGTAHHKSTTIDGASEIDRQTQN